ncbi:MAG: class I SAM-dependent methyltransferase [Acidobacteriia bacterium]|nr:class I SAM-dependent methyltransferase [Terriglobia bacterium]
MSRAFDGFPLEEAIAARAAVVGIVLPPPSVAGLAAHARAVMRESRRLHLTAVLDPAAFVERHLGESFDGAAMVDPGAVGTLLDLGSGNGYPGLPLAAARPRLKAALAEASPKKAEFLREVIAEAGLPSARVIERQIQRPGDLDPLVGGIRLVVTRAAGGWERILPRLRPRLDPVGEVLVWAGVDMETVRHRVAWRRLELVERRLLRGRERSWVWRFRGAG